MNKEVVIIGLGWVGQANALALAKSGFEVFGADIRAVDNIYKDPDFRKIRIVDARNFKSVAPKIVCVNALNDKQGVQDLTSVTAALAVARRIGEGVTVLRSTVIPTKLASLDFDLYVPEFLHELHAIAEVLNPPCLVIGAKNPVMPLPSPLRYWKEKTKKIFLGTPEEAAFVKYISNLWNALRIAHVNELGNIMRKRGMQHDKVLDFLFERKSYLKYGREFSGHCLPKDSLAFATEFSEEAKLIRGMVNSNEDHKSFIDKHHPAQKAEFFNIHEA